LEYISITYYFQLPFLYIFMPVYMPDYMPILTYNADELFPYFSITNSINWFPQKLDLHYGTSEKIKRMCCIDRLTRQSLADIERKHTLTLL